MRGSGKFPVSVFRDLEAEADSVQQLPSYYGLLERIETCGLSVAS